MSQVKPLDNVSVIVPCLNEIDYIQAFLDSLLSQDLDGINLEVIIADGMSSDGTRGILEAYCKNHPEVRLIDNPEGIVSTGLNAAIGIARGDIIIRMDVHMEYEPDYIRQCCHVLKETGADNVGGAWRATGKTYLQKAIALAFQSPFSSGGAAAHSLKKEGIVDSVCLGCWNKAIFQKIGLFDPELVRNQDDELNLRITRLGGRIWQSRKIKSRYYPRTSLKTLFKQYSQYGYWKVRVMQKHKIPASVRHLIPGGFVALLIVLGVLSPFSGLGYWLLKVLVSLYIYTSLTFSLIACRKPSLVKFLPVMPLVFFIYHLGYGYGCLRGLIDFILLRKKGRNAFATISRGAG